MAQKAMIGMSGGVDSSVAAYLTQKAGYECIGATMRLHEDPDCCADPAADACAIACKLNMPFHIFDMTEDFRKYVTDHFAASYEAGLTPNPCIVCNRNLKFHKFLEQAEAMDCEYIVTGHYARIAKNTASGRFELKKALDSDKDQSYFLYNFTQEQLSHTLMPLGDYSKPRVREIAEREGLISANKPDSQEICFVEDGDYAKFIQEYSNVSPTPGKILDTNGNIIGEHKGLIHYTIGQRKGIGAYGRPMFVMKINPNDNTIILGEKGMEFSSSLLADNLNFISGEFPLAPINIQAKARYQASPSDALLIPVSADTVKIEFKEPQRAITPGQAVVFYDGDIVLGGGTIL